MNLKDLIIKYRTERGISQRQFANACSLSNGYIALIEKGLNPKTKQPITPTLPVLKKLAKGMNISLTELFMIADDMPIDLMPSENFPTPQITNDTVVFPVVGNIAAGYNQIAVESWSGDTVEIPLSYLKGRKQDEFFVLRVDGDSMYPLYQNGDKVLILKQTTLNRSGDVGAVLYNDENATLKKVEYVPGENWLKLLPINPSYLPETIEGEALQHCRIIGIPKLLIREIE